MNLKRHTVALILTLSVSMTGCLHHQLRYNTVNHAKTVADVHTKQVLDNLAKFAHNPNALPHFSVPASGSSEVRGSMESNGGFNFSPHTLTSWMLGIKGTRNSTEGYTMSPINDPRKLELMRCAYQRAVSSCCMQGESGHCPNCEKRFNKFYLGSATPKKVAKTTAEGRAIYRVKKDTILGYKIGNVCHQLPPAPEMLDVFSKKDELQKTHYYLLGTFDGQPAGTEVFRYGVCEPLNPAKHLGGATESNGITEYPVKANTTLGYKDENGVCQPLNSDNHVVTVYENCHIENSGKFFLANMVGGRPAMSEVFHYIECKPLNARIDLDQVYESTSVLAHTLASGEITSECLHSPCWFHAGSKCDAPKPCQCSYVGRYCDTYVWVDECHRDQLTKLTMTILDIAIHNPPSARTKKVVAYLNTFGEITEKGTAAYKVTAEIPIANNPGTVAKTKLSDPALIKRLTPSEKVDASILRSQKDENFSDEDSSGLESQSYSPSGNLKSIAEFILQKPVKKLADFEEDVRKEEGEKIEKRVRQEEIQNATNKAMEMQGLDNKNGLSEKQKNKLNAQTEKLIKAEIQKKIRAKAMKRKREELARRTSALKLKSTIEDVEGRAEVETEIERQSLEYLPPTQTPLPGAGYLQFRQNLNTLAPPQ